MERNQISNSSEQEERVRADVLLWFILTSALCGRLRLANLSIAANIVVLAQKGHPSERVLCRRIYRDARKACRKITLS